MKYTFEVLDSRIKENPDTAIFKGVCEIFTRPEELKESYVTYPYFVEVYDNLTKTKLLTLNNVDALEGFLIALERNIAWKPKAMFDAVEKPKHYQAYFQELQWLEAMQYLPEFRNPEHFKAALRLQIRKYLDRQNKDDEAQELGKCNQYLRFLIGYIKKGGPIRWDDL
jgi:hypothetical protein